MASRWGVARKPASRSTRAGSLPTPESILPRVVLENDNFLPAVTRSLHFRRDGSALLGGCRTAPLGRLRARRGFHQHVVLKQRRNATADQRANPVHDLIGPHA